MRSYSLLASAKINLYLEIIGDRPDGYHELAMVLQSIDLADRIDLRAIGTDTIRVRCDHPQVPPDKNNLAYRAADLLAKQFPDALAKYGGVEIAIHKQIPVAAGLAGGSANAAAVLVGMDLLWQLGLTQSELQELGGTLGSDVPFCITGGTALATGAGINCHRCRIWAVCLWCWRSTAISVFLRHGRIKLIASSSVVPIVQPRIWIAAGNGYIRGRWWGRSPKKIDLKLVNCCTTI